jgi:hypothetical protein
MKTGNLLEEGFLFRVKLVPMERVLHKERRGIQKFV